MKKLIKKTLRNRGYDLVRHIQTPALLSMHNVDLVIDVGANDGDYASTLREEGWSGPIFSIEPQPEPFKRLSERFKEDLSWRGRSIGLGAKPAFLPMNVAGMDVLSSFLERKEKSSETRTIEVEVHRLDDILDDINPAANRVFVKVDTQGFERNVIRGSHGVLDRIKGWQLELSVQALYEDQPRVDEMIGMMREMGYDLWRILPGLRDPLTLQVFELDGIFFKR